MRRVCLAIAVTVWIAGRVMAAQPELIERTLALVDGQAITLSDARAAVALGLVPAGTTADPLAGVANALVDRELILREVRRYAPPEPGAAAIEAKLDEIRQRFPATAAFLATLEIYAFTETRLRAWVGDDLRTDAYLAQRFASASTPTDTDIAAAYQRRRAEFEAKGLTFEQAIPSVRNDLSAARRTELITDWVSDLRRRSNVVVIK